MSTPKLLHIGIQSWFSPFQVGSQAISREFARLGWDVAYISAPITPFHIFQLREPLVRQRFRNWMRGGENVLEGGVWHYVPFGMVAPANRFGFGSHFVFRHWHWLSFPNIVEIVRSRGFGKVDLLLIDSIFQPYWLDVTQYRKMVFRVADYNAGFLGYGDAAAESEEKLINQADLVVCSARVTVDRVATSRPKNILYLPNGVDLTRFAGAMPPRPVEYSGVVGPVAIYVGAFGEWFDFELLAECVAQLPDIHFVLVGPIGNCKRLLAKSKNLQILGPRNSSEVVALMKHATVGLLPFRVDQPMRNFVDAIHPLKLYEYCAAGLGVIATRWRELEAMNSPAILCDGMEDFVVALGYMARNPSCTEESSNFASKADWSERVGMLQSALANHD